MAVPKTKISKSRKLKKLVLQKKPVLINLVPCLICNKKKQLHTICKKCNK